MIGATWLIGLGIIFLVQRAAEFSWGQAWPLFVILAGVAGLVGVVLNPRYELSGSGLSPGYRLDRPRRPAAAETTGSLSQGPAEIIADYWPWAPSRRDWFVIGPSSPTAEG